MLASRVSSVTTKKNRKYVDTPPLNCALYSSTAGRNGNGDIFLPGPPFQTKRSGRSRALVAEGIDESRGAG